MRWPPRRSRPARARGEHAARGRASGTAALERAHRADSAACGRRRARRRPASSSSLLARGRSRPPRTPRRPRAAERDVGAERLVDPAGRRPRRRGRGERAPVVARAARTTALSERVGRRRASSASTRTSESCGGAPGALLAPAAVEVDLDALVEPQAAGADAALPAPCTRGSPRRRVLADAARHDQSYAARLRRGARRTKPPDLRPAVEAPVSTSGVAPPNPPTWTWRRTHLAENAVEVAEARRTAGRRGVRRWRRTCRPAGAQASDAS